MNVTLLAQVQQCPRFLDAISWRLNQRCNHSKHICKKAWARLHRYVLSKPMLKDVIATGKPV
jgi:hypothetical protein